MTAIRRKLEHRLGHRFSDDAWLQAALTHRSAEGMRNYERLEFLGDALLSFVIAQQLYDLLPDASEGDLTRLRASLVRKSSLVDLARELELGDAIALGPGEIKSGGHRRGSILADALEAVLGAVFKDAGYGAAAEVITRLYSARLASLPDPASLKDAKTRLQEWLQSRGQPLPVYAVEEVSGAAHERLFRVACTVPGQEVTAYGEGSSRRRAEQQSAERALAEVRGG